MSHKVVRVRRAAVAPCMTCHICSKLLREATTIIECLHTFCKKCIYKKLSDEEMDTCPECHIYLGCSPLEKLRADHNLQDIRVKLFPPKKINVEASEAVTTHVTLALPAKRKERSLSSLVINTPKVSPQANITGKRSKYSARKGSKGSTFTVEKPVEEQPERFGSPESSNKFAQNVKQNSTSEATHDIWKPLTCLVEAASQDKSSKSTTQGSKRPKMLRKARQKTQTFGEFKVAPQAVLNGNSDKRNHPIWFSLVASDQQDGDTSRLPQISASYLRIKDGDRPISFIQKYLKRELSLESEAEVEITCMGQTVIPTLKINNLVDLWLQTTSTDKVRTTTIGSSAKDFVMVLGYARRCPDC